MSETNSNSNTLREPFDRRKDGGPFDIIGDVHGCSAELQALLEQLGYRVQLVGRGDRRHAAIEPPPGRRTIFVGDLVDRGPCVPDVLRIVMALCEQHGGSCVIGNHDEKFLRWLKGRDVTLSHGLDLTVAQMAGETDTFRSRVRAFLERLPFYLWLAGGRLVVAHAGIAEDMIGRDDARVRRFCLYGDTTGETDELGLPVRYHWAATYWGSASIVYGHTPIPCADWVGNTLCLDTGCCFGGALTALRWPEGKIVSVPALKTYAHARRPFGHPPVRPSRRPSHEDAPT